MWRIDKADAVQWLEGIPTDCVDLIVTDPAYESLEKHRAVGTTTRLTAQWFDIFPNSRYQALFEQLYRVLAKNAHLYVFCDAETMFLIKPIGELVGFKFWKPIVWDKMTMGMGYHYRCQTEFILFFEKGKRKLNSNSMPDVLRCNRVRGGYPTEKPVDLLTCLIEQSSIAGELVVDPFVGSGSTGASAVRAGREFWGCDVSERAAALATARCASTAPPI
jgi:site-specific DNA-methyltransferase (adenine-specific)